MSDKTYAERFGTPSRPDGCPVLIAAALTKAETENAALRRDVYQCPPTSENSYEGFKWRDACEELERENAALREALATAEVGLKHALMMEPGDPFKRIKAITAALDAVRAARKEAQP